MANARAFPPDRPISDMRSLSAASSSRFVVMVDDNTAWRVRTQGGRLAGMTKDELDGRIAHILRDERSGRCLRDGCNCYRQVIAQLADERDVARDQRDRALALLREDESGRSACRIFFETEPCRRPAEPCWEHRARALLAEVGEVGE